MSHHLANFSHLKRKNNMAFLHGIEHLNLPADLTPVNDIATAVIGLTGTAESGALNQLILCTSAKDDAQFGEKGTIPEALKAIRSQSSSQGSAIVIVVCVGTDTDEITGNVIVGTISETGVRTGMKLFETSKSKFGFEPMIYIVPHYSTLTSVMTELIRISDKYEALAYIDAPDGMTFQEMIEARGTSGEFANLTDGQKLLYPQFMVADPSDDTLRVAVPMSAYMAGLRAKVDLEEGWHVSSSNHRVSAVLGLDTDLTFELGDPNCEVNLLNANGVTTAVQMLGGGIVEWGNYTAGFPGNAGADAFESVRRTRAIMKRTIEMATIRFIDKPFNQANIDAIRNTVNQYLNTLVSQSKIIEGTCYYRPESNPVAELAKGHVTFNIEFTPSLPMQRITYTYKIDLSKLANIA